MASAHKAGRLKATTVVPIGIMALVLSACGGGDSQTSENESQAEPTGTAEAVACDPANPIEWKHGILHKGSEAGFVTMAEEQGFYEDRGIKLETVEFASGAQIFPGLVAGEVDSIEASPGALFPAAIQGADNFRVTGSTMPGLPYAIYAREGIESVEDLEGKTMAISAVGALPDQVAKAILKEKGVDPNSMEYVNAGSNADRYRAVVAGTADATSSPMDFVPQAEADGLKVIALSPDIIPDFPRYNVIANADSLEERPDGMTCFLAAMAEGIQYAIDNPDEAAALTAKALETTPDDPLVTYMTELIIDEELVSPDVEIPTEKLEFMQELMIELGQIPEAIDLDTYLDDSYQKQAMEVLGR